MAFVYVTYRTRHQGYPKYVRYLYGELGSDNETLRSRATYVVYVLD